MSRKLTLHATKREATGSGAARRLRREGAIPGVIYGAKQDNYSIQVKRGEFTDLLRHSASENVLVNLQIEGAREKDKLALIQAVQHNALTGDVVHVDFHAVKEDEEMTAHVRVELVGEPEGVKKGGLLDHQVYTVEVRCLPADLPEGIQLDISALEIGDAVHVSDVPVPPRVVITSDPALVVASVHEIRAIGVLAEGEGVAEGEAGEAAKAPAEGGGESSGKGGAS